MAIPTKPSQLAGTKRRHEGGEHDQDQLEEQIGKVKSLVVAKDAEVSRVQAEMLRVQSEKAQLQTQLDELYEQLLSQKRVK